MDAVARIAHAVLYEGYLLWPYRRSALKNQRRFTFGGVHPAAFARREGDASQVAFECLLQGGGAAEVDVEVRFLHLVDRRPARLTPDGLEPVDELSCDGERHVAWQEATERTARVGPLLIGELATSRSLGVEIAGGEDHEWLTGEDGRPIGAIRRSWQSLAGVLEARTMPLRPGLHRLAVRFANRSGWEGDERSEALARTFLSAHVVARARGAGFVSQTDPPPGLRPDAEACVNQGLWPVLVGGEGDRHTMLAAPIILADHPAVAPESPGDLFDGCEIDALLVHSIRALTDDERREMSATDPRTREILERSLALGPEQMARLHGAVRELRPVEE
ncbi:MAG: hypothetical protein M3296_06360 [Actinomycetota bacterium]|nr:hypothetical protein [Actinomycetota bacterium]